MAAQTPKDDKADAPAPDEHAKELAAAQAAAKKHQAQAAEHKERADALQAKLDAMTKPAADGTVRPQIPDHRGGRGFIPLPEVEMDPDTYVVLAAAFCWVEPAYNAQNLPDRVQLRAFRGESFTGAPREAIKRGLELGTIAPLAGAAEAAVAQAALQGRPATDQQLDAMDSAELAAYATQHPEEAERLGRMPYQGAKAEVIQAMQADVEPGGRVLVAPGTPDYQ